MTTPTASTAESITPKPDATTPAAPTPPAPTPPAPAKNPDDDKPPAWVLRVDYVLLGLVLLLTFFVASYTASNSDLWTHLAVGRSISDGKFEFGVDKNSWLTEAQGNQPAVYWVHQSWLFSWLVYQLHELVGGSGLVLGKAFLIVAALFLLSRIGWETGNRWFIVICLAMTSLGISPRLGMHPAIVSFLFLSITMYVLHRAGVFAQANVPEQTAAPNWLWALPPLFALWANLDAWFILGPLVLLLCLAGIGLASWFKGGGLVSGKSLGLVLLVSTLACLANPYHIQAFQLPPELAYLLLSVTDSLGIPVADEVAGAGRTLAELRRADPELATWTISTLSASYFGETRFGLNVAGLAPVPLLLLGLICFTLAALIRHESGPTLQLCRFAVWLFFAVAALSLYRMIPFFALLAGPVTALTLGEFLAWQQTTAGIEPAKRDRGLTMARVVSVPFVLVLIYLAWPGWLHGTTDFNSTRRVAWQARPDASLEAAALALKDLKAKGDCKRVFNTNVELGNLLAWYAPDVQYAMDSRFSLYPRRAALFVKARQALHDPGKPDADWQSVFTERGIDQVALVYSFKTGDIDRRWLEPEHWRPRYGDSRVRVLSWSGLEKIWPADAVQQDWNRQAFGAIPAESRPPASGAPIPQANSFYNLYLDGVEPSPVGVNQFVVLQSHYLLDKALLESGNIGGLRYMMTSQGALLGMPGSVRLHDFLSRFGMPNPPPRDIATPALPILMIRTSRKAVADNPYDLRARSILFEANQKQRAQEDHWIRFTPGRGQHPAQLRDQMREFQLGAALYSAAQLSDHFEIQNQLAFYYRQHNMLDLALEHRQLAQNGLEALKLAGKGDVDFQKNLDGYLKQYREETKGLEEAVRVRLNQWKTAAGKESLLKQAWFAHNGTYEDFVNERRVAVPLGLSKKALEILSSLTEDQVPEKELLAKFQLEIDLLLRMGHPGMVMRMLSRQDIRNSLPGIAEYQLYAAAAMGDYDSADVALSEIVKGQEEAVKLRRTVVGVACIPPMMSIPTPSSGIVHATNFVIFTGMPSDQLRLQVNELCNVHTLRGIVSLEAGNTAAARKSFQDALDRAGIEFAFTERPIAARYLELLNEQKKK